MAHRILITGATGFIGRKLVSIFSQTDHELAIHVRSNSDFFGDKIKVFVGEIEMFSKEIEMFSPGFVFHLAGSSIIPSSTEDERQLWESNLIYGTTLLRIITNIPNLIFVNFTTSLAYEGKALVPYTYYALTKASFIHSLAFYCRSTAIQIFNLILYNVYGEGDQTKRAINYILDSLNSDQPIYMSPGHQQLDFIHVEDVISLCFQLLDHYPEDSFEDIHVGTGRGTSLKQAALLIEHLSRRKTNIHFGAIPYRLEEKMVNVAPISDNRFWKSSIKIETGFLSLF